MASVKIVLDKRKSGQKKDLSFPIKLKIEHKEKHLTIHLGMHAHFHQWAYYQFNNKYPNYQRANQRLNKKLEVAENIIEDYENEIKEWSCNQLRDFIKREILDSKSEARDKRLKRKGVSPLMTSKAIKTIKLFEYGNSLIKHYQGLKKFGRAKSYKQALSAFKRYTNCSDDISFAEITGKLLEEWKINMMNKPMKDTAYNAYLRGLRAIINHGIKDHKLPKDGNYGFHYFTVGTPAPTKKRAIKIDQVKLIFDVKLPFDSSLWHTQQQAIFMFNTNGINFIDMAYMKMNQIVGNFERVKYKRAKNHKEFDIPIAGRSKDILKFYTLGKRYNSDDLVFPILPKEILGSGKAETTLYESRRDVFNGNLKKIAKMVGLDANMTSYVLRHSFATALKHSGTSLFRISEAMGHDSADTTQIYLDSFDTEDNDKVTRSIAF